MKFLSGLLPLLVFFIAYQFGDDSFTGIVYGTVWATVASVAQIAYLRIRRRPVDKMQWITLGLLVLLGGATVALRDERFIKWKPTLVDWGFALAFFASASFTEKNLVRRMLEHNLELPDAVWSRLNSAWIVFFVFGGSLNLVVAYGFSTDVWVGFQLFGSIGLTVLFLIAQLFYLARFAKDAERDPP